MVFILEFCEKEQMYHIQSASNGKTERVLGSNGYLPIAVENEENLLKFDKFIRGVETKQKRILPKVLTTEQVRIEWAKFRINDLEKEGK